MLDAVALIGAKRAWISYSLDCLEFSPESCRMEFCTL